MTNLTEFLSKHYVEVGKGKDFRVIPPIYYASLRDGFRNYYETFRDKRQYFSLLSNVKEWDRVQLSFDYTGADDCIVFSILGFHRFIELLLKDILRRINPFLPVKTFEKEAEVFLFLDQQLSAEDVKTVEFSDTLKRFRYAYSHYKPDTDVYQKHLQPYEFLISSENLEAINILATWRNRVMHNGSTFPNVIAYELLISQRIIPIVENILLAEAPYLEGYDPHYLSSPTGINILKEISNIKFTVKDFSDQTKTKDIGRALLKLQHIKELGKACYNLDPLFRKDRLYYEHLYERPINRNERFAESEKLNRADIFYSLGKCICCGASSMVTYRSEYDDMFTNKREFNTWLKCFNCDYSISGNMGDPNYFGLSQSPIFPTK
ncbi:MAG: hypothetical protein K0S32_2847 [Bacteroidetes bacterium]|jgi:hypothetical protein|nr:hypothetical protein [Bacteroidota bacterium]